MSIQYLFVSQQESHYFRELRSLVSLNGTLNVIYVGQHPNQFKSILLRTAPRAIIVDDCPENFSASILTDPIVRANKVPVYLLADGVKPSQGEVYFLSKEVPPENNASTILFNHK